MDSLAGETTKGEIELALQELPVGLDETYKRTLRRIESQEKSRQRLARKVLSWVVYKEILSISELQHAVAVQFGKPNLDKNFIPSVEMIGSVCAGLITIDTQSDVVRMVHATTHKYLEGTTKFWFPEPETYMAMTCVTYLSFEPFESGFCQTDEEFDKRRQLYPLYDYAAENWGHHARKASLGSDESVLDFLRSEAKVSASTQILFKSKYYWSGSGYSQDVPRGIIGVHLAAYFGLSEIMAALLENSDHLNIKDGLGRTPLLWAAEEGHYEVVKLLIEKGAELEPKDRWYRTPLLWAVQNKHGPMVELLLKKGAMLESRDSHGHTPLLCAAESGYEAVVKLLLEKDADLESKTDSHYRHIWTPLSLAAKNGHEAVVKLLIEKGADVEYKDSDYNTRISPIDVAAEMLEDSVIDSAITGCRIWA